MKAHWNYRVLAKKQKGEIYFQIFEVHYDENQVPTGYSANPIAAGGETLGELKADMKRMKRAFKKPILWYGKKFPKEFKK